MLTTLPGTAATPTIASAFSAGGELQAACESLARNVNERFGTDVDDDALQEMLSQYVALRPVLRNLDAKTGISPQDKVSLALENVVAELGGDEGTGAMTANVSQNAIEAFFSQTSAGADLGIVYTPPPVVDFMLRSAEAVLRTHFDVGLTDSGVRVLDPFAGLGIFLERLVGLRRGDGRHVISDSDLPRKTVTADRNTPEWSAVEIMPLAAHLAMANIESAVFRRVGCSAEFSNVLMGDTFQLLASSRATLFDDQPPRRLEGRCVAQVIIGNPPWGHPRGNSPTFDSVADRVRATYVRRHHEVAGRSPGGKAAGNQFVAAVRWASDRLLAARRVPGVLVFVHPNSLAEAPSLAGMRACLEGEFTDIYVVNLLGDTRSLPASLGAQGAKVFGQGSRNGTQITVLVNDPSAGRSPPARIRYASVPKHSSLETKFDWLAEIGDVLSAALSETARTGDHGWVSASDDSFARLMPVCAETGITGKQAMVSEHALGVLTKCDPFVCSFDRSELSAKVQRMIEAYEHARRCCVDGMSADEAAERNGHGVKWTPRLRRNLRRNERLVFNDEFIVECRYRPFHRMWLYADPRIVDSMPPPVAPNVEQFAVTAPSKRTIFGVLASDGLNEFHSAGIPTRLIPWATPS